MAMGRQYIETALREDPHRPDAEVLRRLYTYMLKESVWGDPDCGLKTRTVEEAEAKLKVMVMAARALRDA